MLRKLFLLIIWFPVSTLILVSNIKLVTSMQKQERLAMLNSYILSPLSDSGPYHLSSSDNTSKVLGASVVAADARGKLLEEFLAKYQSPMKPYAYRIVEEADKNSIDFRLVVAIAMCESNLGKRIPSSDSYNAWGIAVYTGTNSGKVFNDWDHAISWVSKYLKERYIDKGHHTLREIGAIYAPPSVHTGHSWSNCVESFQESIF